MELIILQDDQSLGALECATTPSGGAMSERR